MWGKSALVDDPLFAGFVANSIADKPAIAPAMIGAYLVNDPEFLNTKAGGGFIGAIIVAFIVGYMVKGLKKSEMAKTAGADCANHDHSVYRHRGHYVDCSLCHREPDRGWHGCDV